VAVEGVTHGGEDDKTVEGRKIALVEAGIHIRRPELEVSVPVMLPALVEKPKKVDAPMKLLEHADLKRGCLFKSACTPKPPPARV
jgi:hypothetical protein